MVVVSRDPDGRWYVTFAIEDGAPEPLKPAGHAVGVDLGVTDFAVTSDGRKIANPRHLARKARNLARYQRRLARCRKGCGHRLAELSLGTRQWTCPSCRTRHDRDLNAAKNILAAGQAVTACRAGIRHPGTPRMQPAVKQEPGPVTAGIPVLQGGE